MKRFLISLGAYAIIFSYAAFILPDREIDIRLEVISVSENGSVTCQLTNHGPDVYYCGKVGDPGCIEVFYAGEWNNVGSITNSYPEDILLPSGKAVQFKVHQQNNNLQRYVWRYSVEAFTKPEKKDLTLLCLESIYQIEFRKSKKLQVVSKALCRNRILQ